MIVLAAMALLIFLLLLVSEWLWRFGKIDPEYTRKFVHISVGSIVAVWPLFMSRQEIIGMSIAFVLVVAISNHLRFFSAIHSVQRPTVGEICFALSVGIVAVLARSNWVYFASLMHMSVADGFAAVIGTKFGKRSRYYVFGYAKSVVGTAVFFVVSLIVFALYAVFVPMPFQLWFLLLSALAAVIENVAVRGLDNLLIPVVVAVGLNMIH